LGRRQLPYSPLARKSGSVVSSLSVVWTGAQHFSGLSHSAVQISFPKTSFRVPAITEGAVSNVGLYQLGGILAIPV